jgi:hypothetical protein
LTCRGWEFVLAALLAATLYLVGGAAYTHKVTGARELRARLAVGG